MSHLAVLTNLVNSIKCLDLIASIYFTSSETDRLYEKDESSPPYDIAPIHQHLLSAKSSRWSRSKIAQRPNGSNSLKNYLYLIMTSKINVFELR